MAETVRRVAIVGGVRTPFCRSNTLYADLSNQKLLATALQGLVERYGLQGEVIDEVVGGAVVSHSRDWNLAREAVLSTDLAPTTPGITLQQACGTSLQAAFGIAARIAVGEIECGIACGSDTTSDAPIVVSRKLSKRLIEAQQARSFGARLSAFKGLRPGELAPQPPSVAEPRTGLSMGQHCELMAKEWGIGRAAQDALALESHRKAAEAYRRGVHDALLVPCAGVFRDNIVREDMDAAKVAALKPVFDRTPTGTLTAANSTALTDGASAVLLASEAWAHARGLPILAWLRQTQTAAVDFTAGEGLLIAPTVAVAKLLERAGLKLQDFDTYEIHEAFAAQVLATLAAWEDDDYCKRRLGKAEALGPIDRARMNVHGSSLAYGHPFAATGGRILALITEQLAGGGGKRGLISICTAGGMGVAAIVERA
jgi:acetyl-CoA C-acetyltransferase